MIGRAEAGEIFVAGRGMVAEPAQEKARRARRENGPAKVSMAAVLPGSKFKGLKVVDVKVGSGEGAVAEAEICISRGENRVAVSR